MTIAKHEPQCWPSELVDEVMPMSRATPADWLPYLVDGKPLDDLDELPARDPIAHGDVVEFMFREVVGSAVVTVENGVAKLSPERSDFDLIRDAEDPWTFADNVENFAPEWLNSNEDDGKGSIEIPVTLENWPPRKYRAVKGESGEFLLVEITEEEPPAAPESLNV